MQSRLEKPACAFWLPWVDSHLAAWSAGVWASMSAKLFKDSFELQCMQEMGNGKANRLYEAFLPENFRRPQTDQHPFFAAGGGCPSRLRAALPVWEALLLMSGHQL